MIRHRLAALSGFYAAPEDFYTGVEDNGTDITYPFGCEFGAIRISTLSVLTADGKLGDQSESIRKEIGSRTVRHGEKPGRVFRIDQPEFKGDAHHERVQFGFVGQGSMLAVVSFWSDTCQLDDALNRKLQSVFESICEKLELVQQPVFRSGFSAFLPPTSNAIEAERIRVFDEDDVSEFMQCRRIACRIASEFALEYPLSAEELDSVFLKWAGDKDYYGQDFSCGAVLGSAFADLILHEFGLSLGIVDDEDGETLVLFHPDTGLRIYPVNSVLKRNDPEDAGFFTAIYEHIRNVN